MPHDDLFISIIIIIFIKFYVCIRIKVKYFEFLF